MDPEALDPDGGLPISAYAKLEFEQFSFFIQTLTLLLGRKAKPGDSVDVHLGASKSISRNHAKIHYHFHASAWEIEVLGKNGAFVNERYVGAGETFPLHNEDKLQIAETPFTFLLPEGAAPPIDPSALAHGDFDPLMDMPVETVMPSHTMNMEYMSDMLHPTTPLAPHDLMMGMQMEIPQLDDSLLLPAEQVSLPLPQALPALSTPQEADKPTPKKKPRKKAEKRQKDGERALQYVKPHVAEPTLAGLSALLEPAEQAKAAADAQQGSVQPSAPRDAPAQQGADTIMADGTKPKKPRKKYTRKPKPVLSASAPAEPSVAQAGALQIPVPVPVSINTEQNPIEHDAITSRDSLADLQYLPSTRPTENYGTDINMNMVDDSHIDKALLRLVPTHDDDLDGPSQQASIITQNGRTPAEQQAYNEALARQQAVEEEGLVLPPEETDPEVIASFQRPQASYATLIYNAIASHPNRKMTLAQIYNWICIHHPYYRYVMNGWQNSIRHNLSLNKAFMKVTRTENEPGKGAFWAVDPKQEALFENGVYKKRPPKPVIPPLSSRGNPIIMKDGKLALNPNFFVGAIQGKADEAVKLLQEAIQKQLGENTTPEKAAQIAQALALALAVQLKQADEAAKETLEEAQAGSEDSSKSKTAPATTTEIKRVEKAKPKLVARPPVSTAAPRHARPLIAMPVSGPSVDERQRQAALRMAMDKNGAERSVPNESSSMNGAAKQQAASGSASPAPSPAPQNVQGFARSASPAVAKSDAATSSQVSSKPTPVSSVPVPGRAPYQALPGRPVQLAHSPLPGRPVQTASSAMQALPGRPVQGPSTVKQQQQQQQQQQQLQKVGGRISADLSTPVVVSVQSAEPAPTQRTTRSMSPAKAHVERQASPVRAMKRPAEEAPVAPAAAKTART